MKVKLFCKHCQNIQTIITCDVPSRKELDNIECVKCKHKGLDVYGD